MTNAIDFLWFAFVQAYVPMNNKVNVTVIDVISPSDCYNDGNIKHLEFFSAEGVLMLEIENIVFMKLLYSVVSSATGTSTFYCAAATKLWGIKRSC